MSFLTTHIDIFSSVAGHDGGVPFTNSEGEFSKEGLRKLTSTKSSYDKIESW